MFPEAAAPLLSHAGLLKGLRRLAVRGGAAEARRRFTAGRCLTTKIVPRRKHRDKVEIPGLERVTYGERMHYVPGLAKPVYPNWEKDYKDQRFYRAPPPEEMKLYKTTPCYVFQQRTTAQEGVRQALWLTKSKLIPSLPPHLLLAAADPANQIPNQDERVQNSIKNARFWDTTEERPGELKYSNTLLENLIHLCATLQSTHPALGRRIRAEKCSLAATWKRGDTVLQVRGQNGLLYTCMDPLPAISGKQEVAETADHVLENFYPISPTIDLQKVNVYKEENSTGFRNDYPYAHAHTIFFREKDSRHWVLLPEQFKAKMIMFAFGNALARAHILYGSDHQHVLDHPVTVQAVGTNGRFFHFLVFQLNTTDLSGDDGIKNQVWLDQETELYDFAKVRPLIKKKEVKVPAGLAGYKPETFSKFLALYLHGAV